MSGSGKKFEGEGEVEVLHWQREARLSSGDIQAGEVRARSHSVIRRSRNAAGAAPKVRVAKSSEFREGK